MHLSEAATPALCNPHPGETVHLVSTLVPLSQAHREGRSPAYVSVFLCGHCLTLSPVGKDGRTGILFGAKPNRDGRSSRCRCAVTRSVRVCT